VRQRPLPKEHGTPSAPFCRSCTSAHSRSLARGYYWELMSVPDSASRSTRPVWRDRGRRTSLSALRWRCQVRYDQTDLVIGDLFAKRNEDGFQALGTHLSSGCGNPLAKPVRDPSRNGRRPLLTDKVTQIIEDRA